VTSYVIQYGTGIDPTTGALNGSVSTVTVTFVPDSGPYTRVLSGLTMGTPYYVIVYAVNSQGAGDGQQSTPTRETPRQLPKAPTSVSLQVTSDSMLTIGYDLPTSDGGDPVTAFRVEWDVAQDFSSNMRLPHKGAVVLPAATQLRYTISSLAAGTTYYARVSAGNRVGFGLPAYDPSRQGAVPAKQPPGRPFDLSVAPSVGYCRSILVSFLPPVIPASGLFCSGGGTADRTAPGSCPVGMGYGTQADGGAPVSSYEVQFATAADFSDAGRAVQAVDASNAAGPFAFVLGPRSGANLQPGTSYYVRVAAINARGPGPFCGKGGPLCDGAALVVAPSPAC
jgi:hypothetical protein